MKREVFIMSKRYNHSREFWADSYKKYKSEVKKIGGFVMKKEAFKSAYNALREEGSKTVLKDLVYGSKYGTRYNTALAEFRSLKNIGIKDIKLEEFKLMTTQDFAVTYSAQLADAYRDLRAKGVSGADAKLLISSQWFGSK